MDMNDLANKLGLLSTKDLVYEMSKKRMPRKKLDLNLENAKNLKRSIRGHRAFNSKQFNKGMSSESEFDLNQKALDCDKIFLSNYIRDCESMMFDSSQKHNNKTIAEERRVPLVFNTREFGLIIKSLMDIIDNGVGEINSSVIEDLYISIINKLKESGHFSDNDCDHMFELMKNKVINSEEPEVNDDGLLDYFDDNLKESDGEELDLDGWI